MRLQQFYPPALKSWNHISCISLMAVLFADDVASTSDADIESQSKDSSSSSSHTLVSQTSPYTPSTLRSLTSSTDVSHTYLLY